MPQSFELTSIKVGGNHKHYLHRPYTRISLRREVEASAERAPDGRFLDANMHTPIDGPYDLGHKYGYEFWRLRDMAEEAGWSQSYFNDYMNNPYFYQIEDPFFNRKHLFKMKK